MTKETDNLVNQLKLLEANTCTCPQCEVLENGVSKGMFTRREGYPSKWVNPTAGGQKIAQVYKQNFTGRVTLQPGTFLCTAKLKGSGNN